MNEFGLIAGTVAIMGILGLIMGIEEIRMISKDKLTMPRLTKSLDDLKFDARPWIKAVLSQEQSDKLNRIKKDA